MDEANGFELRAVTHLIRPWGEPAADLERLRDGIAAAPVEVLFRHAVQFVLRHPAADELPPDDFSAWVGGTLQDAGTAERLRFAVQSAAREPGALRHALLAVLDAMPARARAEVRAADEAAFVFLGAHSLSVPTGVRATDGATLVDALIQQDAGTWFLHLIEEPFLSGRRAALLEWLESAGEPALARLLDELSAAGLPIDTARGRLRRRWRQSQLGRRLAEATRKTEADRRDAGREVLARLVRGKHRSGER